MKSSPRLIVGCLSASGLLMVAYFMVPELVFRASYAAQAGQAGSLQKELEHAPDFSAPFKSAALAVRPSVVSVRSVKTLKPEKSEDQDSPDMGDLLDRFFNQPEGLRQVGVGTGVIVSSDGYIITNNHLVDEADEVEVKLSSDQEAKAKLVGSDPRTDLAVIKIQVDSLQAAKFGDSDEIQTGEWVLALGNSFGLSGTLTAGIVSATGRCNVGIVEYENFIQTDAAINPGNSGGPLVSLKGEVVGINTAIFSRSGGSLGIGFAVPSNMVRAVVDGIINEGRVVRGYLGVNIQDLSKGLAESFGYAGGEGALVVQVSPEGPAGQAGVLEGDIIVRLDGSAVKSAAQLRNSVACIRPGSRAQVEIFRGGETLHYTLQIGELDGPPPEKKIQAGTSITPTPGLGLKTQALTPESAQTEKLPTLPGVMVTEVKPGSLSDRAGLKVGDVIVSVQGSQVGDVAAFDQAVERFQSGRGFRLKIQRGPTPLYLFIQN